MRNIRVVNESFSKLLLKTGFLLVLLGSCDLINEEYHKNRVIIWHIAGPSLKPAKSPKNCNRLFKAGLALLGPNHDLSAKE